MAKVGTMALDGGDPRLGGLEGELAGQGIVAYNRPQMRALHDPSVSFEEYWYYSQQTRAEEEQNHLTSSATETRGILSTIFPTKSGAGNIVTTDEKGEAVVPHTNMSDPARRASVTNEEWTNASRAVRTATASAVFYLITTDILGPFGLPYAFATTGWG